MALDVRETCHTCLAAPCGVPNSGNCTYICHWDTTFGCMTDGYSNITKYPSECPWEGQRTSFNATGLLISTFVFGIILLLTLVTSCCCICCYYAPVGDPESVPLNYGDCKRCRHAPHHYTSACKVVTSSYANTGGNCSCGHAHHFLSCSYTNGSVGVAVVRTTLMQNTSRGYVAVTVEENAVARQETLCGCNRCTCVHCTSCNCSYCECNRCIFEEHKKAECNRLSYKRAMLIAMALLSLVLLVDSLVFILDFTQFIGAYKYLFGREVYYNYKYWVLDVNIIFSVSFTVFIMFSFLVIWISGKLYTWSTRDV